MNRHDVAQWFNALAPRERRLVAFGAAAVVLLIAYIAVVEPLAQRRAQLEQGVAAQRTLLAWMNEVAGQVSPPGAQQVGSGDSLFATVDRSARATVLAEALQRLQPEGQQTVRVWLDNAQFDELVRWIGTLEREHRIMVSVLTIERTQESGLVNARLTLERP
ncbi:MAG: type II secretion system protein M [Xanthomonadaceae bacterium]|nr:type II secretion system protein M [Xanthomonadaceae bacterium]